MMMEGVGNAWRFSRGGCMKKWSFQDGGIVVTVVRLALHWEMD